MRLTTNRIALLICVYFLLLSTAYSAVTPVFEPPDEAAHFLYASNIVTERRLPLLEARDVVMDSLSVERHQLPLYYMLAVPLIAPTARADAEHYLRLNPLASIGVATLNNQNVHLHPVDPGGGDTLVAVWIMRFYSMALGIGTLWCIYLTGQIAFPGRPVGLTAMFLAASMPTYIGVAGGINNDNLVTVLYALGIYRLMRSWHHEAFTLRDAVIMGVVLGMISLAKLHGITLFGVVYFWAIVGWWRGRFTRTEVVRLFGVTVVLAVLIAGWYYVRQYILYNDPFAVSDSLRIWSRGRTLPSNLRGILFEAQGVWESFWMVLGHLNVRGPQWTYSYIGVITAVGALGVLVSFVRKAEYRLRQLILMMVFFGLAAALAYITRRMNVSQGRFMFPSLVAFAPLLALGWYTLLGRRIGSLLVIPLAAVALYVPFGVLPEAFQRLEAVDALPESVRTLDVSAEGIDVLGYELFTDRAQPGDIVSLDLYFRGNHPENPVLFVMAVDPLTKDPISGVDVYPGMAPTDTLDPDTIYRTHVKFAMDEDSVGVGPYNLELAVGWRVFETDRHLQWTGGGGSDIGAVFVDGPTFIDPAMTVDTPDYAEVVNFGDAIRLSGYSLSADELAPGDDLTVTLHWGYLNALDEDWTVTLALTDADGAIVAQNDAMPPGYPTSAWRPAPDFTDTRTLTLPDDLPPGEYGVYVGWYRHSDGARLPADGDRVQNDLYTFETTVTVGE